MSNTQVDIESISVNCIFTETNLSKVNNLFFVSNDFYSKSSKIFTRTTTLLPFFSMIDVLILLIFSPFASFRANETNDQYFSLKTHSSESEIHFTHFFSKADILEINIIRSLLCKIIKGDSESVVLKSYLTEKLFELLNKKRKKIIKKEWWDLYNRRNPFKTYRHVSNTGGYLTNAKGNKDLIKTSDDFLPKLISLEDSERNFRVKYQLWTDEGKEEFEREISNMKNMRESIVQEFEYNRKLIDQDKAHVVCGFEGCNVFITYYSYLRDYNLINKNTKVICGFVKSLDPVALNDPRLDKDLYVQRVKLNIFDTRHSSKIKEFKSCQNGHILGYMYGDDDLVDTMSNIAIAFPTGKRIKLNEPQSNSDYFLTLNDSDQIRKIEAQYLEQRDRLIKNLKCDLCGISHFEKEVNPDKDRKGGVNESVRYRLGEKYITHIEKDEHHRELLSEFLEENFDSN